MNIAIFEDSGWVNLLPLTWLRATFELRCGLDRLVDKIRTHLGAKLVRFWVRPMLEEVVASRVRLDFPTPDHNWCLLNGRALVTADIIPPAVGVGWQHKGELIALGLSPADIESLSADTLLDERALAAWLGARPIRFEPPPDALSLIRYPWELPLANRQELQRQCQKGGVHEGRIYPGAHLLNPDAIYVGRGAVIKPGVVLDAEQGPIHIDPEVLIQPNAVLEGPCHIGSGSIIRPGAVIRAGTSIGPVCRIGGEVEASIFHGYSNKQHAGFIGHSYVAEWVNLGAGTNCSDLKNTYGTIRVYINGTGVETGQHFLGTIVGDHAKTGIGTVLPTGCVVGVASNIFRQGPLPKFVPSFAWLTDNGMTAYRFEKAIHIARVVMARREVELTPAEERVLRQVVEQARQIEQAGWKECPSRQT